MMSKEQAAKYCGQWLPAWTGNQPERLAAFYAEDALYADPAMRQGLQGKQLGPFQSGVKSGVGSRTPRPVIIGIVGEHRIILHRDAVFQALRMIVRQQSVLLNMKVLHGREFGKSV